MTRIFSRQDVRDLLSMDDCIDAVESVFRQYGSGALAPPSSLGIQAAGGGFHVKAAVVDTIFAAKINANFPSNRVQHCLPTIQGVVVLCDAERGTPLAIMDSAEITTLRTAAASAVAAKYLARAKAEVVTICGCGVQGRAHLDAMTRVRPIRRAYAVDAAPGIAARFAADARNRLEIEVEVGELRDAMAECDILVTTTTSKSAFIERQHLHPGLFIAAAGADNPEKNEIAPAALASSKVVADILEQSATMGDLHHAIAAGAMHLEEVYAELGEIVAGAKPGRRTDTEIFVFDSTGTALQDVVAASLVYRRGLERNAGISVALT